MSPYDHILVLYRWYIKQVDDESMSMNSCTSCICVPSIQHLTNTFANDDGEDEADLKCHDSQHEQESNRGLDHMQ